MKHNNHKALKNALEADKGKAGMFYRSCTNDEAIIAAGILPLQPFLQNITYINEESSLMEMAGVLHSLNVPVRCMRVSFVLTSAQVFFDWEIMADPFQPTRSVLRIIPGTGGG